MNARPAAQEQLESKSSHPARRILRTAHAHCITIEPPRIKDESRGNFRGRCRENPAVARQAKATAVLRAAGDGCKANEPRSPNLTWTRYSLPLRGGGDTGSGSTRLAGGVIPAPFGHRKPQGSPALGSSQRYAAMPSDQRAPARGGPRRIGPLCSTPLPLPAPCFPNSMLSRNGSPLRR